MKQEQLKQYTMLYDILYNQNLYPEFMNPKEIPKIHTILIAITTLNTENDKDWFMLWSSLIDRCTYIPIYAYLERS